VHHFGPYRNAVRAAVAGCALWLFFCAATSAKEEKPRVETRLGVADVEQVLRNYWRTPRVRAELERYKTSEEFRRKQAEVAELERELAGQRFWFLRRKQVTEEIQAKRNELKSMAEKEAERTRERENEAVEGLLTDIRGVAAAIGREQQLTVIFDSNTPHILFLNTRGSGTSDVTDALIEKLSWR
jgi:Skp family chaperone for outer membrane proteins